MNALKSLYIDINRNMRYLIIGFIVAVLVASILLPAQVIEDNLLLAWGGVALFSLFLWLGDYVTGWWDEIKDEF